MTPNQFQSCPGPEVVNNPESLAFQCSVDCIVKTKTKGAASHLDSSLSALFLIIMATLITM